MPASTTDSLPTYRHPEVVVTTATRYAVPLGSLPYQMTVLGHRQLAEAIPANVPDAVSGAPGIMIQRTTAGGGSIYLSGLLGNYCLLLVDGIRLNNSALRHGPNQYLNTVDLNDLSRIEILHGPGSVLYGSDAVGGVVNMITPVPQVGENRSGGLNAVFQAGGPDNALTGGLRWSGSLGRSALILGASAGDFDDLRGGSATGVQKPTGYASQAVAAKIAYPAGKGTILIGNYQYLEQEDVPRYDRLESGKSAEYVYNPQRRQLGYLRLLRSAGWKGSPVFEATASYQIQDEGQRYRNKPAEGKLGTTVRERVVVETYGLQGQGHWSLGDREDLIIGSEAYLDEIESDRWDENLDSGTLTEKKGAFPDGTQYLSAAGFIRYNRPLMSAFMLHLGLRQNLFSIDSDLGGEFGRLEESFSEPTGEIRLMWKEDGRPAVYAGAGRAFRAPNAHDLTAVGTFSSGIEAPSPGLGPERSWTYELGMKSGAGSLHYDARLYLMELRDLIVRVPGTYQGQEYIGEDRVYLKENVGKARLWGWTGEAAWDLRESWTLSGNVSYAWGHNLRDHEPLTRIPPWSGRVMLRRDLVQGRAGLAGLVDWAAAQRRLSASDEADSRIPEGGTPGFGVLGLIADWKPWDQAGIVLKLQNLLDEDYRIHGSGVNGGGRSATLQLRYNYGGGD